MINIDLILCISAQGLACRHLFHAWSSPFLYLWKGLDYYMKQVPCS